MTWLWIVVFVWIASVGAVVWWFTSDRRKAKKHEVEPADDNWYVKARIQQRDYERQRKLLEEEAPTFACPDCGKFDWLAGPTGGMSINIKCNHCGTWVNWTPVLGSYERIGKK